MKLCSRCGVAKSLADFYPAKGMRDGHRSECKSCNRALKRARYAADPDKYIRMVRRWQRENPERMREYRQDRNARPEVKRKQRDMYYRRTYGVSADDIDEMLEAQSGTCAICRVRPERLASMHVDHDHERRHLRGLLCSSCNHGLGQFGTTRHSSSEPSSTCASVAQPEVRAV